MAGETLIVSNIFFSNIFFRNSYKSTLISLLDDRLG